MNPSTATEYRNLPLNVLSESTTNPRHIFEDAALKELADSIRAQGILSPLLVRPLTEQSFEIVAGARRYRAAQMAEAATVPVRIVNLTNAEALEAQLIENLQRRDVHPMEEAQGFRSLLNLEEPKYSIEQISARTGKTPAFVAARLKLTELAPVVVEAIVSDGIDKGEMRRVCTQADCPVHHPKKQPAKADANFKAEQASAAAKRHWPTPPECECCKPSSPPFPFG